ncbi:MAG: hypothetical protein COU30_05635 [Candidatus Magasanikbacteria bacterium CG10_big_fil_rev_8_21_14_0_10_38_6]|uniref:Acylneuraminate cytidylyltransferase family protein n=1 Tax=Candidatus Magasanikbacteria bacterium CG10_big_fil_rev_8_21_14_0_10_38_6 TaxID=1974647 RepID=A0A2M6NZF4_9BACT|nr:MAG: hypothetical protein COU30_05635 [Candidatus Magasanikbacteria bacterium CG10_big_fil_rev_8_21_14_0_10_38_6]
MKKLNPNILGIITARGDSKRLPGKNIKPFHGKPLLAWSIEVGKNANCFDHFILSTDDDDIAAVGKEYCIDVPFMRPAELATDTAGSFEVVKHAVEWMRDNKQYNADWVVLFEPTAPGRQASHVIDVVQLIKEYGNHIDSIVGISKIPAHFSPYKSLVFTEDDLVASIDGTKVKNFIHRNQNISPTYYINSAIYAFRVANFYTEDPSLWGDLTKGYLMDEKYAFDIDTPDDWDVATIKMKKLLT